MIEVLNNILEEFGMEILEKEQKMMSYLADYAPELREERKILKYMYREEIVTDLVNFCDEEFDPTEVFFYRAEILMDKYDIGVFDSLPVMCALWEAMTTIEVTIDTLVQNWYIKTMHKLAKEGDGYAEGIMGSILYDNVEEDALFYKDAARLFAKAVEKNFFPALWFLGTMKYEGKYIPEDYVTAISLLEEYIKQSKDQETVAQSCFYLGDCYHTGKGTAKDVQKAVDYYRKASEKGNEEATYKLGLMYANGKDVPLDWKSAIEILSRLTKSANKEIAIKALMFFAYCYQSGMNGMTKDPKKSFECYSQAADLGDATATNNLGACYQSGLGVEKNEEKAAILFAKAAEMGSKKANQNIASGSIAHKLAKKNKDPKVFFEWCKAHAEDGNSDILRKLADCYYYGRGTEKNEREAVKYYKKAANLKDAFAMEALAKCYFYGVGVEKNQEEAVKLFQSALRINPELSSALSFMGFFYKNGIQVPKDEKHAFELYQKSMALNKNDETNLFRLGGVYETGIAGVVNANISYAVAYYNKAAELGSDAAKKRLEQLRKSGKIKA